MLSSKKRIKLALIALGASVTGLLVFTALGLIAFWSRVPKSFKKRLTSLKHMIFFNGPIRSALELFYPMLIVSLMTLIKNNQSSSTMISAGVKVAICFGFLPFSLSFVFKFSDKMEDRNFLLKYGAFFTNIEKYNKPQAMFYPFLFLVHRFLMAIIIACMGFNLVLQVFLLTHLNLLMLCWLIVIWPMEDFNKNILELTNGFLVLCMGYFSFNFSDYVYDIKAKFTFGYVYIAIILLFFVFNLTY